MNKINLLLLAGVWILLICGCSMMKGKGAAEPAVVKFHQQFNDRKFPEIYVETDAGFKENVSEKEFSDLLDAVQRKLGTVKNASSTGWFVNTAPGGTFVTLTYDVEFSDAKGTEKFVYLMDGDNARLFNYNINSPQLITK